MFIPSSFIMKKILDHISYIEIAIIAFLIIVCMFFPVCHIAVGNVDENMNAWKAIVGVKNPSSQASIKEYTTFSFLCLLPYLLLLVAILLNILFDNKKNIYVDIIKIILYITITILFFMYVRLLNPASYYSSFYELKNRLSPRFGNYVSASFSIILVMLSSLQLYKDFKDNKEA